MKLRKTGNKYKYKKKRRMKAVTAEMRLPLWLRMRSKEISVERIQWKDLRIYFPVLERIAGSRIESCQQGIDRMLEFV